MLYLFQIGTEVTLPMQLEQNTLFYFTPIQLVRTELYDLFLCNYYYSFYITSQPNAMANVSVELLGIFSVLLAM